MNPYQSHFSRFIIVLLLELTLHFSLHNLLLFLECASVYFVNVLAVGNLLLASVRVLFILTITQTLLYIRLPKYRSDLIVQALTTISNIENLQSLFDCHAALEGLVVHEELD
jgi:hypothetical protein